MENETKEQQPAPTPWRMNGWYMEDANGQRLFQWGPGEDNGRLAARIMRDVNDRPNCQAVAEAARKYLDAVDAVKNEYRSVGLFTPKMMARNHALMEALAMAAQTNPFPGL